MRSLNDAILAASITTSNQTSTVIDAYNLFRVSIQAVLTGTGNNGTIQLQGSNDLSTANNLPGLQTPVNWSNVGSSVAVTTAGKYLIPATEICYRWIRGIYTNTVAGVQTIAPIPDVSKSLASKYFLLSDYAGNNYAIWFKVSGTGSAPTVAGYTTVEQDISTGDTAATIGAALATTIAALNSTNSFNTSGTTTVTVTNKVAGPFTVASDFNTGFTFAVTVPTGTIAMNLNALGY